MLIVPPSKKDSAITYITLVLKTYAGGKFVTLCTQYEEYPYIIVNFYDLLLCAF